VEGKHLEYTEMLQKTLVYIDDHLKDDLDAERIATQAHLSTYHFCRVFRFKVGYSVMEYVRNRKLLFAASELSNGKKIIDIALDYGFKTHSGFSKAFKRYFRCSPERYAVHSQAGPLKIPSLMHIKKYLLGGIVMEPKFVTLPKVKIVGFAFKTTGKESSTSVPDFWLKYLTDGRMEKLHSENFVKSHAEYGACFPEDPKTGEFEYAIGVEPLDDVEIPAEYCVRELPAATYAVFSSPPSPKEEFSKNIQGTWSYIFNEWFPSSEYVYAENCVDFEFYGDLAMSDTEAVCEIYIPVRKK